MPGPDGGDQDGRLIERYKLDRPHSEPTPDEIKERAAAIRRKWVDGDGVLVRYPNNDELPDRGPGIRICKEPTFR